MAKKIAEKAPATFDPYQRTKTISYIEKDAPDGAKPFDIKMVSDLTVEEVDEIMDVRKELVEAIADKPADDDVDRAKRQEQVEQIEKKSLDLVAPYVLEWPFRNRQGEEIPPPAEGGGAMFKKVPTGVLGAILRDLVDVNLGRSDPKS